MPPVRPKPSMTAAATTTTLCWPLEAAKVRFVQWPMVLEMGSTGMPHPCPSLSPREHPPNNYLSSERRPPRSWDISPKVYRFDRCWRCWLPLHKNVLGYIPTPTCRNIPCLRYDAVLTDRVGRQAHMIVNFSTSSPTFLNQGPMFQLERIARGPPISPHTTTSPYCIATGIFLHHPPQRVQALNSIIPGSFVDLTSPAVTNWVDKHHEAPGCGLLFDSTSVPVRATTNPALLQWPTCAQHPPKKATSMNHHRPKWERTDKSRSSQFRKTNENIISSVCVGCMCNTANNLTQRLARVPFASLQTWLCRCVTASAGD